jgi:trigger factor
MGMDVNKLLTAQTLPQMQERSRPEAIVRLKEHLALQEVAHRESLQVEPEAIDAKVKEWLEQLGEKTDTERVRGIVESDLLKEKALKWLEERATVELVPQGSLSATPEETIAETTVDASVTAQPDAEQAAGE